MAVHGQCCLVILYFVSILQVVEATVTLNAPSDPLCFGRTYKLTCMHPVLANNLVGWKRNETVISVSNTGSFIVTHYSNMTNSNITNLIINVTREEFQNKVYTYRCFTHKDNNERIYSNNITVHPPGNPSRPNSVSPSRSSSSLLLEWKHFDVCYHNIHYKVSFSSEHGGGRAETLQVIEANITIEGLVPNTAYTVIIRAVSVTVESVPLQLSIITLKNTTLKASPLRNCHVILTCQHHNRNDIAFNAKSTFWKKNNGSFVEYLEGVVMNKNEETVLSIMAEYGDRFICAMKLQNGGLEESNTITIQRLNHQCTSGCALASCVPAWSAFGVVTSLLIVTWSTLIATCVVLALCMHKKVNIRSKNEKCTSPIETAANEGVKVDAMEWNPSYVPIEMSQTEYEPTYI